MSVERNEVLLEERQALMSLILIEEVLKPNLTTKDWIDIFNLYFSRLMTFNGTKGLSLRSKLAVAIAIVGSQNLELFMLAFKLMLNWDVGGCFWIVQEELLRHYAMATIRNGFANELGQEFDREKVVAQIVSVTPSNITNDIVRQKMNELRDELSALVDSIEHEHVDKRWELFVNYSSQFPLQSFVTWYLDWAQDLLRRCGEGLSSPSSTSLSSSAAGGDILSATDNKSSPAPHNECSTVDGVKQKARTLHFIPPATVAIQMSNLKSPQEPLETCFDVETRDLVTFPPAPWINAEFDDKECRPSTVPSVISVDALDSLFVTAPSSSSSPREIEMNNEKLCTSPDKKHTEMTGAQMVKNSYKICEFIDPAQRLEVIPYYPAVGERQTSKMTAAVSALVALGAGVLDMLGPLTQYSTQTSLSGEGSDSSQEDSEKQ